MIRYDDAIKRNPARGAELRINEIVIPTTTRPYNADAVWNLSRSIEAIGLERADRRGSDGRYVLVAGRHRLEALKLLHHETVRVRVVDFDDIEARMWTISENLHRTELTARQYANQVAEWARLAEEKKAAETAAQVAHPVLSDGRRAGPQHQESGDSLAARELGIGRDDVRRSKLIAALPADVQDEATKLGLDDNQAALLRAAKERTPEAQTAVLHGIADRGRVADRPPPPTSPDDYGTSMPVRATGGPITRLPRSIELFDMQAWLVDAPDSERLRLGAALVKAIDSDANRRRLADDAFKAIDSAAEKLKHDELVQLWIAEHERGERA